MLSLGRVKLILFGGIALFFVFLTCCDKEAVNPVPSVFVNVTINVNNYSMGINQSLLLSHVHTGQQSLGYNNNGLIVYRADLNEFYAYDRTCPFHIEQSTAINSKIDNPMFAICPHCSSIYQLFYNGFPTEKSQSIYPLRQYRAMFNQNNGDIYISN